MKIEIKNFGPIDNLTFDLNKDLHLIYGKNAIGKSYATYCIYCLLKNIKNKSMLNRYLFLDTRGNSSADMFIKQLLSNLHSEKSVNCTMEFNNLIESELKDAFIKGLQNSLLNTFSSLKNLENKYNKKHFTITIFISKNEKLIFFSNKDGILDLKFEGNFEKAELIQKSSKSVKYSFLINDKLAFGNSNEKEFIQEFTNFTFFRINQILRTLNFNIQDIYYLPASRSGLYQALNAFTPIIAELTQSRFYMQSKSIELPSLSEPLADYFIDLSTVDKKHVNKQFAAIIKSLENDILQGEVVYNDKTKRIHYLPLGIDLELNLSEASSMVAELSPLVLYFKHILNNKYTSTKIMDSDYFRLKLSEIEKATKKEKDFDIIFIEEPEAHLHPEVQVKLMEIFAKLSSLNLKIFITSHSNYMFNKLNNLLIKKSINASKIKVYHLIKKGNGTVANKNMVVSKDGIDDENFQDISEQLYNERIGYLESIYDSEN